MYASHCRVMHLLKKEFSFLARGFLHGIEYETQNSPLEAVHDHDVPCAMCLVRGSTETLMIPGTSAALWDGEVSIYTGYLVSSMALRSLNMTPDYSATVPNHV